ncbi:DUF2267 domain-containing protein [Ectothiorhodospiraceae bacterium 2226]|nr:DUF2267 domain-containing protein [Ectothiorhodospiraceae bacterium 2226]
MSSTGVQVFDKTLQTSSVWLSEIMDEMAWKDRHMAYVILRAVLHALRDRLMAEEAVDLGAQLPMLVRGLYYEGWRPAGKPLRYRHKAEFLERLGRELPAMDEAQLERSTRAVFKVLADHVTRGEITQVIAQLPAEVRAYWPREFAAAATQAAHGEQGDPAPRQ